MSKGPCEFLNQGLHTFCCKRPVSTYFRFCGMMGSDLSQLLNSAVAKKKKKKMWPQCLLLATGPSWQALSLDYKDVLAFLWLSGFSFLCDRDRGERALEGPCSPSVSRLLRVSSRDLRASSYTHTTRTAPFVRTPATSSSFRAKPTSSCWETPWGTSRWLMGCQVWRTFSRLAS